MKIAALNHHDEMKLGSFNCPPNWPQPPVGWQPPAGWQPDPAWGPAPAGWQFNNSELDQTTVPPLVGYSTGDVYQPTTASRLHPDAPDAHGGLPEEPTGPTAAAIKKPRASKWLAWTLPTVALLVVATLFGIYAFGMAPPVTTAPAPVPTPTPTPTRPPLPTPGGSPTPGTVTGGLSPDKTYSEYKGTGNADVTIVKLKAGPNLITLNYRGTGTFKAAQLNAEEENTRTLVNVTGGNHTGKYLLDLWQEDGESKAIRIKSSGGAWNFKIQHLTDVRDISDVKTYEGRGDDVLYYPFNVGTEFLVRHPSDGPFSISLLSDGNYDTLLSDEKEEFLTYHISLKSRTFVVIKSDGAWSMNPK